LNKTKIKFYFRKIEKEKLEKIKAKEKEDALRKIFAITEF